MRKSGETQKAVYNYIKEFIAINSYPPTVREIGAALGLRSTSTVHMHISNLAEKGLIICNPSKQRSITLPEGTNDRAVNTHMQSVPLVGNVAAGIPILAVENIQEYYVMPKHLLKGANDTEVFMLRVQGQSMIEAGINDGDIIIIQRGMSVESGEIGVVRVSGESATLKRVFYENGNKIRLQPENSSMQPIIVDINDVEIVGKLIGLYREY